MSGCQVKIHLDENTFKHLKEEDYRINIIMPIVFHRSPKPIVKFFEHDYSLITTFSWNVSEPEESKRSPGKHEQTNPHMKHFHKLLSKKDFYNGQIFICFVKPGVPVDQIVRYTPTYGMRIDTTKYPSLDLAFHWSNGWQCKVIERMISPQQDLFELFMIPLPPGSSSSSPPTLPPRPTITTIVRPTPLPSSPPVSTSTPYTLFPPTTFLRSHATSAPLLSAPTALTPTSTSPTTTTHQLHLYMNHDTRKVLKTAGYHLYMMKLIEYTLYDVAGRLVHSMLQPVVWVVEDDYQECNEIVWCEEYVAFITPEIIPEKSTISSFAGWIPLSKIENETVVIQRYQETAATLMTIPSIASNTLLSNPMSRDTAATPPRAYTIQNQSTVYPLSGGIGFISPARELLPLCILPIPPHCTVTFHPTNKVFLCFSQANYVEGTVVSTIDQNTAGCIVHYQPPAAMSKEIMFDERFGWFIPSLASFFPDVGFQPHDPTLKDQVTIVPATVSIASLCCAREL